MKEEGTTLERILGERGDWGTEKGNFMSNFNQRLKCKDQEIQTSSSNKHLLSQGSNMPLPRNCL